MLQSSIFSILPFELSDISSIGGSNPVGTAKDNTKEPIKKVGFFVV